MTSLMVLSNELEALCELVDEQGSVPQDILDRLTNAKMSHQEKVGAYVYKINAYRHAAAALSERAELLTKRAKTCERIEKAIKERLMYAVAEQPNLNWQSSEGDKISVRDNPETLKIDIQLHKKSYSNIVDNVVPMMYDDIMQFVDITELCCLNTAKVKEYLQAGNTLSWARLERGQHLRIT